MALNKDVIALAVPESGVDNIYFATVGQQTVAGSNPNVDPPTEYVIPHGKGEIFDAEVIVSEDGNDWYPPEFPPFAYNATYAQYLPVFGGGHYVTATAIHLFLQSTETPRTLRYSIVGYL